MFFPEDEELLNALRVKTGKDIILHLVRWPDSKIRGRITGKQNEILIEFNDFQPGFFWHRDGFRALLKLVEKGITDYTWYDEEDG